jgi:hypothetical protein
VRNVRSERLLSPSKGRFRRVGRDVLDAELGKRPPDLRVHALRHLAAGLWRMEIVAAAIGVERTEQPVGGDRLGEPEKARHRALLLHQDGRVDCARRIVESDHEIERRPVREPAMCRSVLMQHHAQHRPARPLAPVRPAPRSLGQQAPVLQIGLGPAVAPAKAVVAP